MNWIIKSRSRASLVETCSVPTDICLSRISALGTARSQTSSWLPARPKRTLEISRKSRRSRSIAGQNRGTHRARSHPTLPCSACCPPSLTGWPAPRGELRQLPVWCSSRQPRRRLCPRRARPSAVADGALAAVLHRTPAVEPLRVSLRLGGRHADCSQHVVDRDCARRGKCAPRISGADRPRDPEVTSPFAHNCTLSGAQGERFGNGAERSQSVSRPAGIPVVITGERDVLPSERRDMGEQLV